jgi:hypothetical protein
MTSPLTSIALFHVGPVPITTGVVVTWAIMAVLVLGGIFITRRLSLVPSATQTVFELIVATVDAQIRDTMRVEPPHIAPLSARCSPSYSSPIGRRWCRASNRRRLIWRPMPHWRSSFSSQRSNSVFVRAACAAISPPSPRPIRS